MKFLPIENITYKTQLQEKEIVQRLSDIVAPEKIFRYGKKSSGFSKSYEGKINGHTFEIKRIIGYRNSFLPRINGNIEQDFDGTTIKIKMRLQVFVIAFLCIWCAGVGLVCITTINQIFGNLEFNLESLIPLGSILFVYLLTMGGFKYESKKSKKDLQAIFVSEIIEE